MFKNLKLSYKLSSGFGSVLILFLFVMVIYHNTVQNSVSVFNGLLETEVEIAEHAAMVKTLLLQCRGEEKAFLTDLKPEHHDDLKKFAKKLIAEAEQVAHHGKIANYKEAEEKAALIIKNINLYTSNFNNVVDSMKEKGLNESEGLRAKFKKLKVELEEEMSLHDTEKYYTSFLEVTRSQHKFMLIRSAKTKKEWLNRVDELIAYGNTKEINDVRQMIADSVQDTLPDYKKYFLRLINSGALTYSDDQKNYDAMMEAMGEIIDLINATYFPGARAYDLQVQNHENNYFLTRDKKYIQKIKDTFDAIREAFKNSDVAEDFIIEAESIFIRYTKMIEKIAGIDERIDSFLVIMNNSASKISPIVEELNTVAHKAASEKKIAGEENIKNRTAIALIIGTLAIIFGMCLAFFISRGISKPLIQSVDFAKKIAGGDLTARLAYERKDEIGILVNALNDVAKNLSSMFGDISVSVEDLAASSSSLTGISNEMIGNAEDTEAKSNQVAAAAEEMSSNVHSVTATMEEASTSMSVITETIQNMDKTISEISQKTGNAREISSRAVNQAQSATSKIDELSGASNEIGQVTETITDISEQTNLLALNATIESARAGEAGKGFAVVAGEIKTLAQQTAEATKEISLKVQSVQSLTSGTMAEINEISSIINQIDEIVEYVSHAVEQQSATTREIAENVEQTSTGMSEINNMMNQNMQVTSEITKDITGVNTAAIGISDSSAKVSRSADDLSDLAEKLKSMMSKFVL